MTLSVNDFTAGDVITASAMNTNFATIEGYVNSSPGLAALTGATFSGTVTFSAGLTSTGGTTALGTTNVTGAVTVGVDGTGHDVKFFGDSASHYMLWDQSADALVLTQDSAIYFYDVGGERIVAAGDGHLTIDAGTTLDFTAPTIDLNASTEVNIDGDVDLNGALDVSGTANLDAVDIDGNVQLDGTFTIGVDDTGYDVKFFGATAGKYMLWDQDDDQLLLGASGGSAGVNLIAYGATSGKYMYWNQAADTLTVAGTVSKTAGSFDIAHPTKGGDWRLRHSFIEGPTADNIYRGTVTISGDSVSVDLDAVSGMTDGTWEGLNTNPWSMVSSSGNAVTWSLSGKTLTIAGPDGAVCSWMVIGERKDEDIKDSSITDDTGKLIVEYK